VQTDPGTIELRLRNVSQLFNTLDPFPFRERDLAPEAEEYIIDWAQDLPADQPVRIVIHVPPDAAGLSTAPDLAHAITTWFGERTKTETRQLRTLFRDGRLALLIGVIILSVCLFLALRSSELIGATYGRVLQESLIIVGWVVIWRPAEIFLYDWLPIVRRRKLFSRLANATVTVQTTPPAVQGG
jgi:hypothetical protein